MAAYTTTSLSSVTIRGTTWNFLTARPCWQFPNGDWGVQLPVTITGYLPAPFVASDNDYNGGMVNPVPGTGSDAAAFQQGFREEQHNPTFGNAYVPALNYGLSLPLVITSDCSVCNVIHCADYNQDQVFFDEFEVLTCLSTIPENGSFRPPYAGTDKTLHASWTRGNLVWANMASDPIPDPLPSDWPDITLMEHGTKRPMLDLLPFSFKNTNWKAANTKVDYAFAPYPKRTYGSQQVAVVSSNAAILVNAAGASTNAEQLACNMVQWAIDNMGIIENGGIWLADGGHQCGRKVVNIIAAALLPNNARMLATIDASTGVFNSDRTHFFVSQSDIDTEKRLVNYTGIAPEHPQYQIPLRIKPYVSGDLGTGDFAINPGDKTSTSPQMYFSSATPLDVWNDTGNNSFGYRQGNAGADITEVYIAQRLGLRSACNNEPMFRYMFDKVAVDYLPGYGETIRTLWAENMVPADPVTTNRPSGYYESGVTISASTPTLGATIRFTTDGITTPTDESTSYTSPIAVTETTTLKFVPFAEGLPPGDVTTVVATIVSPPAPPRITP